MRGFSILSMMGAVVILALGLAALRNANTHWLGGTFLVTIGLLLTAVVGVAYTQGRTRAGWLGFAMFGSTYLLTAFTGFFSNEIKNALPSTSLLWYAHRTAAPVLARTTTVAFLPTPGAMDSVEFTNFVTNVPQSSVPNPSHWATFLPGAANYHAFSGIGHCLFAMQFGLLGAVIARRFERARGRDAVSPR